jgi:helix-turn-helix protein
MQGYSVVKLERGLLNISKRYGSYFVLNKYNIGIQLDVSHNEIDSLFNNKSNSEQSTYAFLIKVYNRSYSYANFLSMLYNVFHTISPSQEQLYRTFCEENDMLDFLPY